MIRKKFLLTLLASTVAITGCANSKPGRIDTAQGNSADGRLSAYQVSAIPTSGMTQNSLLIWDNHLQTYVLKMGSESRKFSEALMLQVVAALPALISGAAAIKVADSGACDSDAICGTVVYGSQAVAGAQSGSSAGAKAGATVSGRNTEITPKVFLVMFPNGAPIALVY